MGFSANVNISVLALRQSSGNSNTISTIAVSPESELAYTPVYDREPNDTLAAAQPISGLPVEIVGTMNTPGDLADGDLFSVNLRAGTVLYVIVVAESIGSPLHDVVDILNSSGTVVASGIQPLTGRSIRWSGTWYRFRARTTSAMAVPTGPARAIPITACTYSQSNARGGGGGPV